MHCALKANKSILKRSYCFCSECVVDWKVMASGVFVCIIGAGYVSREFVDNAISHKSMLLYMHVNKHATNHFFSCLNKITMIN